MMINLLDPNTVTAIASAIFGGAGVEILKRFVMRRSESFNESLKLHEEVRKQMSDVRHEMETWKHEADEWRSKYWEQVEKNAELHANFESLQVEVATLKAKIPDSPRSE